MPQWKAFTTGLLFAIAAIGSVVAGLTSGDPSQLGGYLLLAGAFALPSVLLLGLWYYRWQRDRRIVKQAAAQWQHQSAPTLPPMEITTNDDLFVPDDLHS